jgi:hypothetical protein
MQHNLGLYLLVLFAIFFPSFLGVEFVRYVISRFRRIIWTIYCIENPKIHARSICNTEHIRSFICVYE